MNWFDMQVLHPPTSKLLLFIDLLSVIPFDMFYYLISPHPSLLIVISLRLRYALRISRFISEIGRLRNLVGSNPFIIIFMEYVLIIGITLFASNCVAYLLFCAEHYCPHSDAKTFLRLLYEMVGKVTTRSLHTVEKIPINILYISLITNLSMYIYLKGFIISKFVNAFKQFNLPKGLFTNKALIMYKRYSHLFRKDQLLKATLQEYYASFWKTRHGILNVRVEGILPEMRQSEIKLDLSWKCFRHSHLFRGEELHFLHHLSQFVQNNFKSAGEILYKKGEIKTCMIYVVAGIIQIYSDEDGETPILSFSGGTVLGETSLILSSQSVCTVVCKSDCEIDVLEARDFINITKNYPEKYRKFRTAIFTRLTEARDYHKVKAFQRDSMNVKETSQLLTMKWLKLTLNTLLSKDPNYFNAHLKSLNIEDRLLTVTLTKLFFCSQYLDLLVLAKQIEFMGDRIFVKTTFPCILQPESVLTKIWEKLISIAVFVFIFVYPLYAAFFRTMSLSYVVFITVTTLMWGLDVFIQISTAIKARNGLITTITEISAHKITKKLFILDVLAAVPLEVLTVLITGYTGEVFLIYLQMNRVLKIAKIDNLFASNKKSVNTHLLWINCLKCTLYLIILIYWIAAFIYLLILQDGADSVYYNLFSNVGANSAFENLMVCIFLATLLVTGLNLYLPSLASQADIFFVPLIIIVIITIVLCLTFFGNITATESIRVHGNLVLQEYYKDIKFILKTFNFDQDFSQRILRYTNHQWLTTNGIDFLQKNIILSDMPRELFLIIRRYCLLEYVQKVPLFQEIPRKLLTEYCGFFLFWDIPAGQIITYAGEVASEMYIISAGYCETISADGQIKRTIGPGNSFAVVETCMKVPIINNVIAATDCVVISLTYSHFVQASAIYPEVYIEFQKLIERTLSRWLQQDVECEEIIQKSDVKQGSFVHFGYRLDRDAEMGVEYFSPFERLGYWSFLRYLLLRTTVHCHGKFACYWELIRCIVCFFSIIMSAIPHLATCTDCVYFWILRAFDINALMDIYLRHHITYFNPKGIEVTHPLKTAAHYWKHSFIIDVIAVLPILFIVDLSYGRKVGMPYLRSFLRYNKILQIYRIVQGLNYLCQGVDAKLRLWTPISFILLVLIAMAYGTTLAFNINCVYGIDIPESDLFGAGVRCSRDSWVGASSDFEKPIELVRLSLYCLYYITSIVTGIGLHGFYLKTFPQVVVVTFFAFAGFLCFEFISAKIVAINLSRNVNLTVYQEATRVLMKFLNLRKIDEKLKFELIEHFEYVFFKLRGINLENCFSVYSNALKEEAMYKIFGNVLKESNIFRGASPSFFRSLLLHVKHQLILRRGIISRVNDVSGTIFFIFKGEVEVLGPDYNRLLVLPRGSVFGNLDEVALSRRTLTMVAKGHVELLEINTINFYTILNRYGKLKAQFKKMTMINVDYLAGGRLPKITRIAAEPQRRQEHHARESKHVRVRQKTILTQIFGHMFSIRGMTRGMQIWDSFILIVVCFIGFIVELYRFTMSDRALTLTILLYLFDFLYIVRIYLKFHMSFVDEMGAFMTNRKSIAKHYLKTQNGFRLDIITIIPFEFIAGVFIHNEALFWKIFIYSRCNRFIRLFFVVDYFRKTNKKININVYRVKALEMVVFIILTLQLATTIVIVLGCTETRNTYPEMICNLDELASMEKFHYFIVQLSNVISVFTATSFRKFYPNSPIMIVLLVIYMLMCRMLIMLFMAEICATWEVILHNRLTYEHTIKQYKKLITMQGLSPVLIKKTWDYFRLLWGKQAGLQFPTLLEEAPYYLREAVLNSMFGYHLRNHAVLKNCHVDLIRQMAACMRTQIFFPGDYIAFQNDIDECMYFIHEGEIFGLVVDTLKVEVVGEVFSAGDMFGLNQGMYPKTGHDYTYKVNRYSIVVVLKRTSWIHLLDFYPASKVLIFDENLVK